MEKKNSYKNDENWVPVCKMYVVPFSFGIKHSHNMKTIPIQVKIINPSLTPITI